GLRLVLSEIDEAVETVEAGNFPDALARVADAGPFDLVLLDLTMPGMAAFEGLQAMRERAPEAPIIVLSASEKPSDVSRAIECGARGYVLKSSRPQVLLHAVPLVLSGEVYLPPVVLSRDGASGSSAAANPAADGEAAATVFAKLTPREREVLGQLVAGQSNKEIAHELAIDVGTVKAHLKALLRKLEVANRTQAATLAVRAGWGPSDGDGG
ncbi:MAG: LuxR C-terminal-related transcriptional regulator, partial [Alphaproteobacteria bacterium]